MSVINNVLKDLEHRSSDFTPIDIASVDSDSKSKSRHYVPYIFALVLLILAAAYVYMLFSQPEQQVISPRQAIEPLASVDLPQQSIALAPEVILPAPVNRIVGLQIQESSDAMSLQFALQGDVISYLKERSESGFVYHLRSMGSEISAPLMTNNRWIKQLQIVENESGVDIIFSTRSRVVVETRQQSDGNEVSWIITLTKLAPKPAKVNIISSAPELKKAPATRVEQSQSPAIPATPIAEKTPLSVAEAKEVKLDIKSSKPDSQNSKVLQRAKDLLIKRQPQEAEVQLLTIIGSEFDLEARKLLLDMYLAQKRHQQLSSLITESMKKYADQAVFKTVYARSLYELNDYRGVVALLNNNANNKEITDSVQIALLAASFQRLEQHEQAIRYYKQSLNRQPRAAKNWIALGISQEQVEAQGDALTSYRTASRLGSLNERLRVFVENRTKFLERVVN